MSKFSIKVSSIAKIATLDNFSWPNVFCKKFLILLSKEKLRSPPEFATGNVRYIFNAVYKLGKVHVIPILMIYDMLQHVRWSLHLPFKVKLILVNIW